MSEETAKPAAKISLAPFVVVEIFHSKQADGNPTRWDSPSWPIKISPTMYMMSDQLGKSSDKDVVKTADILRPMVQEATYGMICVAEDTLETVLGRLSKHMSDVRGVSYGLKAGDIVRIQTQSGRILTILIHDPKPQWTVWEGDAHVEPVAEAK
jgi:hypothetical protein